MPLRNTVANVWEVTSSGEVCMCLRIALYHVILTEFEFLLCINQSGVTLLLYDALSYALVQ